MRNDVLMNGVLIGFGLGFIFASLALLQVVRVVLPQYAGIWLLRGVIIIGVISLAAGIGTEVYQRVKTKKGESKSA